jgi:hypothetical protein
MSAAALISPTRAALHDTCKSHRGRLPLFRVRAAIRMLTIENHGMFSRRRSRDPALFEQYPNDDRVPVRRRVMREA